jgi:hypothetical protein
MTENAPGCAPGASIQGGFTSGRRPVWLQQTAGHLRRVDGVPSLPWPAQAAWAFYKMGAPVAPVSWPAPRAGPAARPRACLCRPSTTGDAGIGKDVDGRAKPGHDTVAMAVPPARYVTANRRQVGSGRRHVFTVMARLVRAIATSTCRDRHSRSLDTCLGIFELPQRVMEERIPGVCLCRGVGFGRLSDGQELLGYWNP